MEKTVDYAVCSFGFISMTVIGGDAKKMKIFYMAYCDNRIVNAGL